MATRTVSVGLRLVLSQWSPSAAKAAKDVDKVTAAAQKMEAKHAASWDKVGKASAVAAVGGALAIGKMVSATMNFDKAMSGVAAVSGAAAGELGKLREAALQAGQDTVFSASQAAEAEAELAKAGVSTADILGGALKGSLDLAAAGQLDLGEAATISAQAMNIWKLEGRDVAHIADVLAAGANKSAADVGELGDAMRQGGLVAAQMGIGMEDTVAVLSAFADNALIGSDAGTSLKTMLQKLMAPSKEAAAVMDEIGLQAFDASGQFVGLENFAGQLQTRLGSLTQEQRSAALATIFGSDAIRAANVLYEIGGAGVADYARAVNDQGAAARMAGTQMDNLAGDLEQLRGSVETALIKGGSGATSVLRGMTQGATGFVNAISGMPAPLQAGATAMLALGTAGAGALFVLGSVAPRIKTARAELEGMGRAGHVANTAIGKVGKGLAIGTAGLAGLALAGTLMRKLQDASFDAAPGVEEVKSSLISLNVVDDLAGKLPNLGADLEYLGAQVRRLADPSLGDKTRKLFVDIATVGQADPGKLRDAQQNLRAIDEALTSLVQSGHGEQAALAFREISAAAARGGASVEQVREALPGYRDALAGVANESELAGGKSKALGGALGDVGGTAQEVSQATDELGRATKTFTGKARDAEGALTEYASAAELLKTKLDLLNGVQIGAAEASIDWQNALIELNGAIKENGKRTEFARGMTDKQKQAVLDNKAAVLSAVKAAQAHAEAVADQTGSVEAGNVAFGRHLGQLRRVLGQAGLTKAQIDRLVGSYRTVPKKAETKVAAPGAARARDDMEKVRRKAGEIPNSERITITASDRASGTIQTVTRQLNNLNGSRATVYVEAIRIGTGALAREARQHGGPVVAGRTYEVLEKGPELFIPQVSGQILSTERTMQVLRGAYPAPAPAGSVSRGGATVNITIPVTAPAGADVRTLAAEISRRVGAQADLLVRAAG